MTRLLSELLGAREPMFQQSLRQLEILAGHPQTDIRLSTSIANSMRAKLVQLGLDAADTTGPELYAALGQRLRSDEIRFAQAISSTSTDSKAQDVLADVVRILKIQTDPLANPVSAYAIKISVAKRLFKASLPKKTMKLLGYRSADSMLKHETIASLYAAARLIESQLWSKRIMTAYGKLRSSDFEQRPIAIEHPTAARWQQMVEKIVVVKKQNVVGIKELGFIVIFPLPIQSPILPALTTTVLGLQAINNIQAAGTFLKLHQMESHFGNVVQQIVSGEPLLPAANLDVPVSWHSIHQYYSRISNAVRSDIFEPVVAAEEMAWLSVSKVLADIEPSLEFWQQTDCLAMLARGKVVSCNITDNLLSHCNVLSYEQRLIAHFRQALHVEILLKYMSHDKLERIVINNLQNHFELVPEEVRI